MEIQTKDHKGPPASQPTIKVSTTKSNIITICKLSPAHLPRQIHTTYIMDSTNTCQEAHIYISTTTLSTCFLLIAAWNLHNFSLCLTSRRKKDFASCYCNGNTMPPPCWQCLPSCFVFVIAVALHGPVVLSFLLEQLVEILYATICGWGNGCRNICCLMC